MVTVFSKHARLRMKERRISSLLVKKVLKDPDETFSDTKTGYTVYTKQVRFQKKMRLVAVTIDEVLNQKIVVTVHPIRERDVVSRKESGRWI